jgi:hypothetical protein
MFSRVFPCVKNRRLFEVEIAQDEGVSRNPLRGKRSVDLEV